MSSSAVVISERRPRPQPACPLVLSISLSVLGCGWGNVPADATGGRAAGALEGSPLPAPSTSPLRDDAPTYTPLPRDRVGALRATDFALLRCGYRVDDRWYSLDCEIPIDRLSRGAREELDAVLSRLAQPAAGERAPPRDEPALRRFELNVRTRWIFDLEIEDTGLGRPLTAGAIGAEDSRRDRADARELAAELRRQALETLLTSGERPRRAPPWQALALADFIAVAGATVDGYPTSRELYQRLVADLRDARPSGHGSRLAARLLASVELLTDDDASRLLEADVTVARVLPLTRIALRGDREALFEVFRLAMEYGGDPAVFAAAARRLFPADLNQALVARHPPARDRDETLLLLATVRRWIERAEYESPRGWRLPVQ